MSSLLYLMRQGEKGKRCIGARTGRRPAQQRFCRRLTVNRSLTLPLLCSGCRFEIEPADQVEGGLAQRHPLDTGPEVNDVALLAAGGVEAVEDVVGQVDAERAAAAVATMDGTGTAALGAAAPEARQQPEVIQDLGHGYLVFEMGEVDKGGFVH